MICISKNYEIISGKAIPMSFSVTIDASRVHIL